MRVGEVSAFFHHGDEELPNLRELLVTWQSQ